MTRETMEAWENACEMHFTAFQNFMRLTDGDIGLCCPKKDECTAQCDYLDSYEYTEECRHYRKGE